MPENDHFAARYKILRTLGAGGMGVVYLVEDTRRDNQVMALKTMREQGDREAEDSFRSEFLNVRGVVHPNIPQVFDFGQVGEPEPQLFFTCEYVEGKPLDQLSTKWSVEQIHVVLVSLCRALAFLHSRGLLHRDIKPENVLGKLSDDGTIQSIKLVDFGLSARRGESSPTVGTIAYMAPELITGSAATVASDIYAIGMLLYRLAAGQHPFESDDPLAAAKKRCTTEVPPALRFNPDLPVGLSDVLASLLRIKPEDRPPSARHVIARLNEYQGTQFPYETSETRMAYIRSGVSVTHREVRAALAERKKQFASGDLPLPTVISSPPGLGRRRLLRDFAAELSVEGIAVRTIESDDSIVQSDCNEVLIVPHAERMDTEKRRIILNELANQNCWPILGTTAVLQECSDHLGEYETLTLRPMELDHVAEFVAAMFPENIIPSGFAAKLHSGTLGIAAAMQETLDLLLETEQLRIGLSGWELLPGRWEAPAHPTVAKFIEHVLTEFSPASREFAELLACSTHPLPEEVLKAYWASVGNSPAELDTAVHELSKAGWLRQSESGLHLCFSAITDYHEQSRNATQLRSVHEQLRTAWERKEFAAIRCRDCELLYHDIHASRWSIPADKAAATLRAALDRGEVAWVRRLVETGLLLGPSEELSGVLLDALTMVEFMEGNVETSALQLGELLQQGDVEITDANLERTARYAMLEDKLGRADHAREILERCLGVLPEGHDRRAGMVFGTLSWVTFKHGEAEVARKLAEDGLVRVPPEAFDAGYALLLNTVGTLAFYRGDLDAAELYWKRCLEVFEAINDRQGIAGMYNSLGVLAAQGGDRLRARSLWQRCAEIAREINDVHRLAGIYNNLGIDALETGSLPEAEDYYVKALNLFRQMKNPRAQVEILSNLGELAFYRADYPRAQAYLQEAVQLASQLDDREGEIEPLIYLGRVLFSLDELETSIAMFERACRTAHEVEAKKGEGQAWEAMALVQARRGRMKSAQEALDRARVLLSEELDPLARLHFHLTESAVADIEGNGEKVVDALRAANKVGETKWDPYASARTAVYGLLFAQMGVDPKERSRLLRQVSVYPDFLWQFHWAEGRRLAGEGGVRKALDEFGRGAAVLKGIASRLSEEGRNRFLNAPHIQKFRSEAMAVKNSIKQG